MVTKAYAWHRQHQQEVRDMRAGSWQAQAVPRAVTPLGAHQGPSTVASSLVPFSAGACSGHAGRTCAADAAPETAVGSAPAAAGTDSSGRCWGQRGELSGGCSQGQACECVCVYWNSCMQQHSAQPYLPTCLLSPFCGAPRMLSMLHVRCDYACCAQHAPQPVQLQACT